jgi:hypothetical protein
VENPTLDSTNPYQSPASHDSDRRNRFPVNRLGWLLLPVPFLVCGLVLYASTWIGRIGLLHLLMIGPLPLAVSIATAVAISTHLIRAPWHRILIVAYCIGLYFFWSYISITYRLNPFP